MLRFWWRSWWRYKKELKHVGEVWEILIVEILVEVLVDIRNIAKGTTDPRVEFKSQVQTQILIKHQLQNLNQTPASP